VSGRLVRHPADDTLHRLVDGGLARGDAAAVERHVAACDRCRATLEALERLRRAARAAPREVAPPAELWDAIAARVARTPRVAHEPAQDVLPSRGASAGGWLPRRCSSWWASAR
jgi:anti-sigma factor RsiW